jgi:iron complex outermembrane receptor protein
LLSPFGEQGGYAITDIGIGLTNETYELNIVSKNLFDTRYTTSVNDFSNSAPVGYDGIGPARYVGVVLRAHF